MTTSDKAEREIRRIAYALWLRDGQPEGRDREHWTAAKELWAYQSARHDEIAVPSDSAEPELTDQAESSVAPRRGRAAARMPISAAQARQRH